MRFLIPLLLALIMLPAPARADQLQDGIAAFKRYDWQTALKLLLPLAEQGNAEAQYEVGETYSASFNGQHDDIEAAKWWRKAAEQGWKPAQIRVAQRENFDKTLAQLRLKAQHGDADAAMSLGAQYQGGEGVKQDYAEAMKWYRMAADRDDPRAEERIGQLYHEGWGVHKDEKEAGRWFLAALDVFRKKAEHGDVDAQVTTGERYWNDAMLAHNTKQPGYLGSEDKDYKEAANWFRKAADQGDKRAMHSLSGLYATGEGVPRDPTEALFWTLAGENDNGSDAVVHSKDFPPENVQEVRKRLAEWEKAHPFPHPPCTIQSRTASGVPMLLHTLSPRCSQ